ncbi:endonuclease MutS2 [Coprothermobacteraceae bacterium]|nr:endonuclease MutS2 [Coprothermobacteraceae bacterium]
MRDFLEGLEYYKVLEQIKSKASSVYGQRFLDANPPGRGEAQVRSLLTQTEEAWGLLRRNVDPFVYFVPDVDDVVTLLRKQGFIAVQDFLVFLKAVHVLVELRKKLGAETGILGGLARKVVPLESWLGQARDKVDESGFVKDNASQRLFQIREEQKRVSSLITDKLQHELDRYQKFVADRLVLKRGNRYTIPVRSSAVSNVKGIVLDWSGSGQTAYIEPFSVVDLNNKLEELRQREEQEIHRIFMELYTKLYPMAEDIHLSLLILGEIDAAFARAKWGSATNGTMPRISTEKRLVIKHARHPMIPKDRVVPVDIELPAGKTGVIISGPNTGGKTVALKTIGLFAALMQIGAPVPAVDAEIPLYRHIWTDIGDEQSIENSLSTFASHIARLKTILEEADEGDLVLIDELGSGTDPEEGAALAETMVEFLVVRGVHFFVATHLWRLKSLAAEMTEITNASVDFDLETLQPLYRINMGVPGRSFALEIAKKWGMPDVFINTARSKLTHEHQRVEKLIEELQDRTKHLSEAEARVQSLHAELKKKEEELARTFSQLEMKKARIMDQARAEAKSLIEKADQESKRLLKELSEQSHPNQKTYQIRQQIKNMLEEISKDRDALEERKQSGALEVREGDTVYVPKFKQLGLVIKVMDDSAEVQIGPLRVTVPRDGLTKSEPLKVPKVGIEVKATQSVPMKLEVHGSTVEEALERVDKYLDQAYTAGLPYVYIIHGRGTGALMRAIHDYLKGHPYVSKFRLGDPGEGGSSVTIVFLS